MIELFNRLLHNPASARKFLVALAGAVAVAVSEGLFTGTVGMWATIICSTITALGVYSVPNDREPAQPVGRHRPDTVMQFAATVDDDTLDPVVQAAEAELEAALADNPVPTGDDEFDEIPPGLTMDDEGINYAQRKDQQ